ncbi:MAG: hypothetical protein ACXWNC_04265, partial [Anaerolineales bacterium]
TENRRQDILWVTVFSSLTILSHHETALHTAASAVVFFLFFARNKKGLLKSLLIIALILLVTAPWWATVLIHNGISPFIAAGKTGYYGIVGYLQLFQSGITHEVILQTIGTLALFGLFWHIAERKYFVPVWALVIFVSEARNAALNLSPCVAILASTALIGILQLFNRMTVPPQAGRDEPHPLSGMISKGLFLLLSCLWIYSSLAVVFALLNSSTLTNGDINAFDWIKTNTSSQSKFLVLTGMLPFVDPTSEWFPALTDRTSIATVQGYEWDIDSSFKLIQSESISVKACLDQTFQCILNWADKNHLTFDYLYIHNPIIQGDAQSGVTLTSALGDLSVSQGFTELAYQNIAVSIYRVK